MNIKITNADFSANGDNIGREDLRTAPNATTQAILDYYGKTWTLEQQLAVEDFLVKKNSWEFGSKIKKLALPILAPVQASIAKNSQPKAFYDLIGETILTTTYGGAYTDASREITANGLIDNRLTTNNANDVVYVNLGTPTSWQSTHLGAYYHKTRNETGKIIMTDGSLGYFLFSDEIKINNIANADIVSNLDPNSLTTRGLRVMSYNGTNITGLSANLPFASVSGSSAVEKTGDFIPYLLNRFNVTDDVTLGLISFGDALTQDETVIFNADINTLMDALWSE